MSIRLALPIVGVFALLAGCDNATTGTVTSREHVAQHDELDYIQCIAIGSNACAVSIPYYKTVPECWQVNFHNDRDDENGSACVDSAEYQLYRLDDHYPRAGVR